MHLGYYQNGTKCVDCPRGASCATRDGVKIEEVYVSHLFFSSFLISFLISLLLFFFFFSVAGTLFPATGEAKRRMTASLPVPKPSSVRVTRLEWHGSDAAP